MRMIALTARNYLHGDIEFKFPKDSQLIATVNGRNGNKSSDIFLFLRTLANSRAGLLWRDTPKLYAKRNYIPTEIVITLEHHEVITTYTLVVKGDKVIEEVVTIGDQVIKLPESGECVLNVLSVEARRNRLLDNVQQFLDGLAMASLNVISDAMKVMPIEKIRSILVQASLLTEEIDNSGAFIYSKESDVLVKLSSGAYVSPKCHWYLTQATQRALMLVTLLKSNVPLIVLDMRNRDIGKYEYDVMTATDNQVVAINAGINSLDHLKEDEGYITMSGIKGNRIDSLANLIPLKETPKDFVTVYTNYCLSVLLRDHDSV